MGFLENLVAKLPAGVQPYAKALVPVVLAVVAIAVQWADSGTFDTAELYTALGGFVTWLLTYAVPNLGYVQPGPVVDDNVVE